MSWVRVGDNFTAAPPASTVRIRTVVVCAHCKRQACVYWSERACRAARRGAAGVTRVPAARYFEQQRDNIIGLCAGLVLVGLIVGWLAGVR